MENTARKLELHTPAKVVGHINLAPQASPTPEPVPEHPEVDDFLDGRVSPDWQGDLVRREYDRTLAEIAELQAENRWEDIVALFHPCEEKLPELIDAGLDGDVRVKVSFALCKTKRHEEAIASLQKVVARDSRNSLAHYSIGYAVLDFFFQARTLRTIVPVKRKEELIALGHRHFDKAIALRPESVTYNYRHAVLYKDIEDKPKPAVPLFRQAIANWRGLSVEDQQRCHQQRPKYIKSLYHLASCLLKLDKARESLTVLGQVLDEDGERHHMHPLFKHFAMGKVLHALGRYDESLQHLETAAHLAERGQATDFVWELAARGALCLGKLDRATACINRIEPSRRLAYVRWTEADILFALGRRKEALKVLEQSASVDRRTRHKALMRICRIQLSLGELTRALEATRAAVRFCVDSFGNPPKEGRFWEAVCLYRLGRHGEALPIVEELERQQYHCPQFARLGHLVRNPQAVAGPSGQTGGSRPPAAMQALL
jgi:tetratricopeptide (TPR) repeat protein